MDERRYILGTWTLWHNFSSKTADVRVCHQEDQPLKATRVLKTVLAGTDRPAKHLPSCFGDRVHPTVDVFLRWGLREDSCRSSRQHGASILKKARHLGHRSGLCNTALQVHMYGNVESDMTTCVHMRTYVWVCTYVYMYVYIKHIVYIDVLPSIHLSIYMCVCVWVHAGVAPPSHGNCICSAPTK